VQLAPSAFLASAAASAPVFSSILSGFDSPMVPCTDSALTTWSSLIIIVMCVLVMMIVDLNKDISPPPHDIG
jgi:hypothetical protein